MDPSALTFECGQCEIRLTFACYNPPMSDLQAIVKQLEAECDRIDSAIQALRGVRMITL
jgi:hypothetical protein